MSTEEQKSEAFVGRLLDNPAIAKYTPLQKEEQILQFLQANSGQLAPTLQSSKFFPGFSWNQVLSLLITTLTGKIDDQMARTTDQVIDRMINWDFVSFSGRASADVERCKQEVRTVLSELLERPEGRRALTGPYAAVYFGSPRRYLEHVYSRKSYVHFELTKVQRLRMGKDQVKGLVDVTTLLKPSMYVLSSPGEHSGVQGSGLIQPSFAENAISALRKRFPSIPEQAVAGGVHANMSFLEHSFVEATSRLASVFAIRARHYCPGMKVDRGADTPDKSWLSIARRNYKFYGFDVKMVDELYSIAAENMW